MRAVREHLSRGRDPARAAPPDRRAGKRTGDAERSRPVQLRALRQAVRDPADGREHAGQAGWPFDVRRRHAPAADVRRLPRRRHDGQQDRGHDPRRPEMSLPPEEQARADFYALLSRLFYTPPDAGLLQRLANADELEAEDEMLATRWRELTAAAALMEPDAACGAAFKLERARAGAPRGSGRAGGSHRGAVRRDAPSDRAAGAQPGRAETVLRAVDPTYRRAVVRCNREERDHFVLQAGRTISENVFFIGAIGF